MVGKYEIVGELGRGGMGLVYKAFDPGIGRTVALKVMSEQLARDTDFRERFLREARGAGILQHHNIVTIHELGEWQGAPFIAMEFLEGRSLEDILKNEKTTTLEKRLDIVAQVCRGLDYAHARGIVHRDIKPANVMVTNDGVAKVVDFGIARLADQKLTHTGHVLGTVSYMSPEQLQGKVLDGRSDIFAVGVMLFEALTSVLPFSAEDTGSAITNTLYRQPPKLSSFLANYPKELDEIVGKCLAKDPAERFQTAGELADRLSRVQQELQRSQTAPTVIRSTPLPTSAASQPLTQPDSKAALRETAASPKSRRKVLIGIAVSLILLVASLGVGMMWLRLRGTAGSDFAALRKSAESGNALDQGQLGLAYLRGRGVEQSDIEALAWFRKAAEQGRAGSQVQLGIAYSMGRGVKQDDDEAVRWYRKAAEQGAGAGQVDLGFMYEMGRGVPQDNLEAVQWYRKSAEQGFAAGQLNLGTMYLNGKGVPQNYAEAAHWFRLAADQGDSNAQSNLGTCYETGHGVTQDYAEAERWYSKSADQGNTHGQNNLKRLQKDAQNTEAKPQKETAGPFDPGGYFKQYESAPKSVWTDPSVKGLMWMSKDARSTNWSGAVSFCRASRLAGYSDWRLPTVNELKGIFDPESNRFYKVKKGIYISSSLVWSKEEVTGVSFSIDDTAYRLDSGTTGCALCVRETK
jgi:TPR repeat protein/predicted Ser/Thr protein kinase